MNTLTKLIDKDELAGFERWELPSVDPRRKKAAPPPEPEPEPVEEAAQPLTAEQIEAIQEQAYQEGFEQGRRDGLAAGQKEIEARSLQLHQLIASLAQPLAAVDEQVEEELVALALAVARQLIRRELQTSPDEVVGVVREALAALPSSAGNIKLHLHPDDAVLVREHVTAPEGEETLWKVVEDPVISRGGCRVVTDRSRIDATVEKRLAAAVAKLFGGERQGDEGDA